MADDSSSLFIIQTRSVSFICFIAAEINNIKLQEANSILQVYSKTTKKEKVSTMLSGKLLSRTLFVDSWFVMAFTTYDDSQWYDNFRVSRDTFQLICHHDQVKNLAIFEFVLKWFTSMRRRFIPREWSGASEKQELCLLF